MKENNLPDEIIGPRKPPHNRGFFPRAYSAPLKKNALLTLRSEFSNLGFGTGPICRQKESIRIPIHWIYPDNRPNPPFCYYDSVGAVRILCKQPGEPWRFDYTETCEWLTLFGQFFDRFLDPWEPDELFSEVGLAEIRRFSKAVQEGTRCSEAEKIIRYHWVRKHKELWSDPKGMLAQMRRYKLYKTSTPDCQALEHLAIWIERAKKDDSPDGPLVKRRYGSIPPRPH